MHIIMFRHKACYGKHIIIVNQIRLNKQIKNILTSNRFGNSYFVDP